MPTTAAPVEAHPAFRFQVSGLGDVHFTECTLPALEIDVLEQKEGGYLTGVHLLPGPVKAGRVTLKSGLTKDTELLKWYKEVLNGPAHQARRNITIRLFDSLDQPVMTLQFNNAYPVKWTGPTFKTSDSTIAIESLELAFSDVEVGTS